MNKLLIAYQMTLHQYEIQGLLDAKQKKPDRTAHMPALGQAAYAKGYQWGLEPEDEEIPF